MDKRRIYSYDFTDPGKYTLTGNARPSTHTQSRHYRYDELNLASEYIADLPSQVSDLLTIAASVMWADRRFKRPHTYDHFRQYRGWIREFHLTIGVREDAFWNKATIKESLENVLNWLTEDIWHLTFENQQIHSHTDYIQPLPGFKNTPSKKAHCIILYSGGLDSLAGTIRLLQDYQDENVVLLSVVASRLTETIKKQIRFLQTKFGKKRIIHASFPFQLVRDTKNQKEEKTQRTRGFLYFAYGVAQAITYNTKTIITCENGIGMINLPFNKGQLGAQHTRAVHPFTIVLLSKLLSQLDLPHPIQYEAPFLLQTKGEMCTHLKESGYGKLCSMTISCDSFALRLPPDPGKPHTELHCGKCSSCLLRRQAIFAAQLQVEDANARYLKNVCKPGWFRDEKDVEPLKFMLDHNRVLQQLLVSKDPATELLLEFPELASTYAAIEYDPNLFHIPSSANYQADLADLFRRYTHEWEQFLCIDTIV